MKSLKERIEERKIRAKENSLENDNYGTAAEEDNEITSDEDNDKKKKGGKSKDNPFE